VPRVVITAGARRGLERCRQFLVTKNPRAGARAAETIGQHFLLLETSPEIGRPYPDAIDLRELVISFGESGYVAIYRFEPREDAVYILAFRHQKEAGY
jgi:plasmid stabilization system protein ParE